MHGTLFLSVTMFLSNGLKPQPADPHPHDTRHYASLASALALLEFCRVQFTGYRDLVAMLLQLGPQKAGEGEDAEGSSPLSLADRRAAITTFVAELAPLPGLGKTVSSNRTGTVDPRYFRPALDSLGASAKAQAKTTAPTLHIRSLDSFNEVDMLEVSRDFFCAGLLREWCQSVSVEMVVARLLPMALQYIEIPVKGMNKRAHSLVVACFNRLMLEEEGDEEGASEDSLLLETRRASRGSKGQNEEPAAAGATSIGGVAASALLQRMLSAGKSGAASMVASLLPQRQPTPIQRLTTREETDPHRVLVRSLLPHYLKTVTRLYPSVVGFASLAEVLMCVFRLLPPTDLLLLLAIDSVTDRLRALLRAQQKRDQREAKAMGTNWPRTRTAGERGVLPRDLHKARPLVTTTIQLAQLIEPTMVPTVLNKLETIFEESDRGTGLALAMAIHEVLSGNFDLYRRDVCITWYLGIVKRFGLEFAGEEEEERREVP
jgi:hypothetical protein